MTATRSSELRFSGDNAVVTGAASGIGRAVCERLVAAGVRTLALDLRVAEDIAPESPESGVQVSVSVDVRDPDAVAAAVRDFAGNAGIGYAANCAGILGRSGITGLAPEDWQQVLSVNLVGAANVMSAVSEHFRSTGAAGGTSVVNITSIEAERVLALTDPVPNCAYASSKAALTALTRNVAVIAARHGARVNTIAPGFVATPMAQGHGGDRGAPHWLDARVPLGRFARPSEIADAAMFLFSDQASYITGTQLTVDGGFELT